MKSRSKLNYLLFAILALVFGVVISSVSSNEKAEAAIVTNYVPMTYGAPSAGLRSVYSGLNANVYNGSIPRGSTINGGLNEPLLGFPNFIKRVYSASASFAPPACATNIRVALTGNNGSGGQSISYRNHSGGSNGANYPPTYDWAELAGDLWSNPNGTNRLGIAGISSEFGPGSSTTFGTGFIPVTAADVSNGITFSFWVETMDQWSNVSGAWGVDGRQFSFNISGNPYLAIQYDDVACNNWEVRAECTADINTGRITYRVRKVSGSVIGNLNVALTASPGSSGLSTPQTINDSSFTANQWEYSYDVNPPPALGQSLGGTITVTPGGSGSAQSTDTCASEPLIAKPYLRVYGHDTVVGLPFKDASGECTAPKPSGPGAPGVKAYSDLNGPNYVGAGSQFAVSAAGKIEDFISASLHNSPGSSNADIPTGLSFSNNDGVADLAFGSAGYDEAAYQGCIPDYSSLTNQYSFAEQSNFEVIAPSTLHGSGYKHTGTFTIETNGVVSNSSWSNLEELQSTSTMPMNIVIVQGNVNIWSSVERFDGIIIAIPDPADPANTGYIDTCVPAPGRPNRDCVDNNLEINGALIAKKVRFNRLGGDVATVTDNNEPASSANIAEVINLRPEHLLFLSRSDITDTLSFKNKFDSIAGLPPVL